MTQNSFNPNELSLKKVISGINCRNVFAQSDSERYLEQNKRL